MYIRTRKVTEPGSGQGNAARDDISYHNFQLYTAGERNIAYDEQAGRYLTGTAQKLTAYPQSVNFSNTYVYRMPLSITHLQQQNEEAKAQMQEKLRLVDNIQPMMDQISTITADMLSLREQHKKALDDVLYQVNIVLQQKLADVGRKVEHTMQVSNSLQTKNDSLLSREQLRDNIIGIHDEALTNYGQVLYKLEHKVADLEARSIGKDELDVRIKNLEHDVKQMWAQVYNQNVAIQQEMNGNIGNIMGILGILEQKGKSVQLQLDQIRMLY